MIPPRYEAGNHVHCRGEEQWAGTAYGVECRDGTYVIEADRIWEEDDRYGWVRHIAEKEWVDLPDFAEAMRIALRARSR
jgi:hypothetical protein